MLRIFFLSLFLFAASPVFSGKGDDSLRKLITGSWENTGSIDKGKVVSYKEYSHRTITFFEDGIYQEELFFPNYRTAWTDPGVRAKWKARKGTIQLSKIRYARSRSSKDGLGCGEEFYLNDPEPTQYFILVAKRDSLVLRTQVGVGPNSITVDRIYKPVPLRKFRNWEEARPGDMVLVNSSDSLQQVIIRAGEELTFELKNDTLLNYVHTIEGAFVSGSADSINIDFHNEQFHYTDKSGLEHSQEVERDRGGREYHRLSVVRNSLPVKSVKSIKVTELRDPVVRFVGAVVVATALASELFIAPFTSANFTHKTFDTPKFLEISAVNILGGLMIGVPLIAIGAERATDYYLYPDSSKEGDGKTWKIKSPVL